MAAKFERTSNPGIYRRGSRYVVKQRDRRGRMHARSAPTLAAAKDVQAEMRAGAARGELTAQRREAFEPYALEWIATYTGRTSRGLRESTRQEYERALVNHAIPFFRRMPIADITPRDIKAYAQACADKGLKRHGVKNALGPVKAMLATAFEDGDIRVNPAANVRVILTGGGALEQEHKVRALAPGELERFLAAVPDEHRLFATFLARTGLRIGEAIEVRWRDIDLGAGTLHVQRSSYLGVVGPPKSRFGVRTVPLTSDLKRSLGVHKLASPFSLDDDLVFPTSTGTTHDVHNLRSRIIRPAAKGAELPWASFHTLRHTFASMCFRNGCNAKQVQLLLGHHAASFTIDTYIHSIPEDLPTLDFLDGMMGLG